MPFAPLISLPVNYLSISYYILATRLSEMFVGVIFIDWASTLSVLVFMRGPFFDYPTYNRLIVPTYLSTFVKLKRELLVGVVLRR